MNKRILKLFNEAGFHQPEMERLDIEDKFEKFAELIVRECAGLIHLECKDFANGNCFHDDTLWKSVTTEYGKNKERGFDPVGMSIHFDKLLKKHFGVEE